MIKGFILLIALATISAQANQFQIYTLQKGETLSEVLQRKGFTPLWGKDNWVEKTIKINQWANGKDYKLEAGNPIIIPMTQKEVVAATRIDSVSSKMSSRIYTGLIGGKVSHHQNVEFKAGHSQKFMALKNEEVKYRENFEASLLISSNNDFEFLGLKLNPEVELSILSQNSVEIESDESISANFAPSFKLSTDFYLSEQNRTFEYGPGMAYEELSSLDREDNAYLVRRDQIFWASGFIKKRFDFSNSYLEVKTKLSRSLFSDYRSTRLENTAKVNLTQDYFLEGLVDLESIESGEQRSAQIFGINLSYRFL